MVQQQQQHHPSMPLLTDHGDGPAGHPDDHLVLSHHQCVALCVDNPSPDSNSMVFIKLWADPANPDVGDLAKFQITSLNFLNGQVLKMWDNTTNNCDGTTLAITNYSTLLMIIISIILSDLFFFIFFYLKSGFSHLS